MSLYLQIETSDEEKTIRALMLTSISIYLPLTCIQLTTTRLPNF